MILLAVINKYLSDVLAFTMSALSFCLLHCAGMFQSKSKHHAVSAQLDRTFDFTANSFVVQ